VRGPGLATILGNRAAGPRAARGLHGARGFLAKRECGHERRRARLSAGTGASWSSQVLTDDHHTLQEFRASVGAQWTFLSDPGRTVQQDLHIQEYTDPSTTP
jgi:hypothetical protein